MRRSYNLRSWITGGNKNTTRPGHGPPRNPGSPRPGDTGQKTTKPTKGDPKSNGQALASAFLPKEVENYLRINQQILSTEIAKLYTSNCRIKQTTTSEKSLSHCHSNRCGHVGHRPSFLPLHMNIILEGQQNNHNRKIVQFFFPASAYWPVWPGQSTVLSRKRERSCTGPFNWGGAHCAGENVKRTDRTIPTEVS